ncbi:CNNM domain-containing protein [Corynebacterium sp.]|uniref:CNNM domain-containing protein n=1 Tax=Corynebacterium sp. TaxID=1720 RepID=UPI0026DD8115|nr:hemolysin family protein [Corynebacterium sp.]MDO5031048.1 hemolysin family protein [Corynebacterium sp.]
MTDTWWFNLLVTILIIVASAFFVVIEFSLMGARRNRLEETAETSRASRAGLRSLNELTIMLAGAQLGITAATFVLGAVTKPWVHHLLMGPLEALGLPLGVADVVSFILALFVVTFLHLVIGEMAPKSWAITHPETALQLIAVPARGFIWLFRPLLKWINNMANKLVIAAGEEPVDRAGAAGYDAATLRHLVEHSRATGTLDDDSANQISGVIELEASTAGALAREHGSEVMPLSSDATVAELQDLVVRKSVMRVLVYGKDSRFPRVVHVRDTLLADPDTPVLEFSRPAVNVASSTTVAKTLDHMRARNEQIVVVGKPGKDKTVWILTWNDIMGQLWPQITEQLDQAAPAKNTGI